MRDAAVTRFVDLAAPEDSRQPFFLWVGVEIRAEARRRNLMKIRTVRRALAALAIAVVLGLAGAYPAAAAEPGWFERGLIWLSGLWAGEDAAAKAETDGEGLLSFWALSSEVERGLGIDPNGKTIPGSTPPPLEGQ